MPLALDNPNVAFAELEQRIADLSRLATALCGATTLGDRRQAKAQLDIAIARIKELHFIAFGKVLQGTSGQQWLGGTA